MLMKVDFRIQIGPVILNTRRLQVASPQPQSAIMLICSYALVVIIQYVSKPSAMWDGKLLWLSSLSS